MYKKDIVRVAVIAACLVIAPAFTAAQPPPEAWRSWGAASGMNDLVFALTTWDSDGPGESSAQLVAGGMFYRAGGVTVSGIARWDGAAWQPFGVGMNNNVYSLTTWDVDGDGPMPAQLVAGGTFTSAGGVAANRITRWDGTTWQPFGTGMNGAVQALTTWDPDGDGPLLNQLVAGGFFSTAGGMTVNGIALWDGSSWQALGTGVVGDGSPNVYDLTSWDPDGSGPQPALLVAGGFFTMAGGVTVNGIAAWDGWGWQSIGGGFGAGWRSGALALSTWDPDSGALTR